MAFSLDDTRAKVVAIIAEKLSMPAHNITQQSTFKDLGIDSLDQVDLIMRFEEIFDVEIPDDQAANIKAVHDATEFLHSIRKK